MEDVAFERVVRSDAIVCADTLLSVTFERREVEPMRRFMEDFGLVMREVADDRGRLYFRGHGDAPYLVELIPSSRDACTGIRFAARTALDLEALSAATGGPHRAR